jgi:site-specific recombinase XerD
MEELLRAVLKEAGVHGSPHVFRHTFCSHALMMGVTLKDLQLMSGHQDLKTLERYLHVLPGASHAAIQKLERGRQEKLGEIRETRKRVSGS